MKFYDDHTWLSIFKRPRRSRFTRVQRVSCCLSILFLGMVTSAMLYDKNGETDKSSGVEVGPTWISFREVYVSLVSSIIAVPPVVLMVTIFRRSRSRKVSVASSELMSYTHKYGSGCTKSFPWWFSIFGYVLVFGSTASGAFFSLLYSLDWGKEISLQWLCSIFLSLTDSVILIQPFKVSHLSYPFSSHNNQII